MNTPKKHRMIDGNCGDESMDKGNEMGVRQILVHRLLPPMMLLFLGLLVWAHSRDPFRRLQFNLKGPCGRPVQCMLVSPRGITNAPLVIYAHDEDGSWMRDGDSLRQFAELGITAVSFNYDASSENFESNFEAVLEFLERRAWVNTNAVAWVGFGSGARYYLSYLLKHSVSGPRVVALLAMTGEPSAVGPLLQSKRHIKLLVAHGEDDELLPIHRVRRIIDGLPADQFSVVFHTVLSHGHDFDEDQRLILRLVAESLKATLTPDCPLPEYPRLRPYPQLLCLAPGLLWAACCAVVILNRFQMTWDHKNLPLSAGRIQSVFRVSVILLSILALTDTALHMVLPRMPVNEFTVGIAREFLIAPQYDPDFESVMSMPFWRSQTLGSMIDNIVLANYTTFQLVNWRVPVGIYHQFILSPVITGRESEVAWRRELWENFYPRVRHERNTIDAAKIVVRFLRERMTIVAAYPGQTSVKSMWNRHIVNTSDFEILYVAALRSVGVPARLNAYFRAEFWDGANWAVAARPPSITWVE